MISFRSERIVDGVTELTEVEVVFEDKDSASALHAKHRVVDVICEILTQSDSIKAHSKEDMEPNFDIRAAMMVKE